MIELLKSLVKLQDLEWSKAEDEDSEKLKAELRQKIPAPILVHYDRLMARGKKGIVAVRHQTCSGCHMRLPIGVVSTLMHGTDIQLCDCCGRYLYLPEGEGMQVLAHAAEERAGTEARRKKAAARKAEGAGRSLGH
jgi:predicted  nucleic acid-binding Zn-ribbon protein